MIFSASIKGSHSLIGRPLPSTITSWVFVVAMKTSLVQPVPRSITDSRSGNRSHIGPWTDEIHIIGRWLRVRDIASGGSMIRRLSLGVSPRDSSIYTAALSLKLKITYPYLSSDTSCLVLYESISYFESATFHHKVSSAAHNVRPTTQPSPSR